jgi:hypothetical protein
LTDGTRRSAYDVQKYNNEARVRKAFNLGGLPPLIPFLEGAPPFDPAEIFQRYDDFLRNASPAPVPGNFGVGSGRTPSSVPAGGCVGLGCPNQ